MTFDGRVFKLKTDLDFEQQGGQGRQDMLNIWKMGYDFGKRRRRRRWMEVCEGRGSLPWRSPVGLAPGKPPGPPCH